MAAALLVLVSIMLYYNLFSRKKDSHAANKTLQYYQVKKSRFQVRIVEKGTLRAQRSLIFASEIQSNKAKIAKLITEGTYVKKGELLLEFDPTPFQEDIERTKTEKERAKAEVVQAEEDLKTERVKTAELIRQAEESLKMAQMDLKSYEEGTAPLKVSQSFSRYQKARIEKERMKRDYESMKKMLEEGFVTKSELEQQELRYKDSLASFEAADAEHNNLVQYEHPAQLENMKIKVVRHQTDLEKMGETNQYLLSSKDAAINRAKANLFSAEDRIRVAEEQLRRTKIYSPIDGFVIYTEQPFGLEKRKLQVGDTVWTGQQILTIPDTSSMLVDTRIREIDIYKVKNGQKAFVRSDAYPDLRLTGTVTALGTLAKGADDKDAGAKYFSMVITLDATDSRLRPGMTARTEVLVYEENDVLSIPLEALYEKNKKTVCYLIKSGGGYDIREIVAEMSNEDFALIRKGLAEGDRVLLSEPAAL